MCVCDLGRQGTEVEGSGLAPGSLTPVSFLTKHNAIESQYHEMLLKTRGKERNSFLEGIH